MPFRERFESFFSRPKVQKQLVTIFILVLLVPITFCCFLLYESYTSLREHYLEQIDSDNLRVRSILFEVTTNLYNVSEDIVHDQLLFDIINTEYASSQDVRMAVSGYPTISNIMVKDTSISSVNIYTFNETIGDYSHFHTITPEIEESDWFISASEKASGFWQTHCRTDSRGNNYWELCLYRKIPLPQLGSYAVLAITASDNYLRNRIINNSLECIMTINDDPVFFSTDKNFLGQSIPVDIDYTSRITNRSGIMALNETPAFTVISTLLPLNSDDKLYIVSYNPSALNELTQLIRNYILIIAAVILIPCCMFFIYSQYFSARVMTLRKAMHQASHGNYEIMDVFSGNDELSETFQDLRLMIEAVKEKEAEIYQSRIREQEIENRQQQMEFKMLSSQINPHFLYNTLETIRMKAFTNGDREVATAIKLLGKSMRYVLNGTGKSTVPLSTVLSQIHTYISIQKFRFGDRVHFDEDIMEGLDPDEYSIQPLLLQPIVENAIIHGLEGIETNGYILLQIREEGEDLYIGISDNGNGMTEDELAALRIRICSYDQTRTRSIGLYNINQRLSLCYGPDCKLMIDSVKGAGTTISMKLPLNKIKEELTNEGSYRR